MAESSSGVFQSLASAVFAQEQAVKRIFCFFFVTQKSREGRKLHVVAVRANSLFPVQLNLACSQFVYSQISCFKSTRGTLCQFSQSCYFSHHALERAGKIPPRICTTSRANATTRELRIDKVGVRGPALFFSDSGQGQGRANFKIRSRPSACSWICRRNFKGTHMSRFCRGAQRARPM